MKTHTEWRLSYCQHDSQGGYWPMGPYLFRVEGEALREYRKAKGREHNYGNKDVKLELCVVVSIPAEVAA